MTRTKGLLLAVVIIAMIGALTITLGSVTSWGALNQAQLEVAHLEAREAVPFLSQPRSQCVTLRSRFRRVCTFSEPEFQMILAALHLSPGTTSSVPDGICQDRPRSAILYSPR